jgi:hypothetical protein
MPGLEQVEKAQTAIERNPLAFVAAFFAVAFFALLALYLRARDRHLTDLHSLRERHAAELNAIHDARLAEAVKVQTALHSFLAYVDKVQAQQKRRAKPASKRRVPNEDVTVRIAALPSATPPPPESDDGG